MSYQRSPGGRLLQKNDTSPERPARVSQAGVRYITEDMIKKAAKEEQIEIITTLSLTLSKESGKKIKYLENLDRLKKLQVLNLSCNIIEKMEKLDKLTKLRELNLSYNRLTKVEGIETLTGLQILNFTGNQIEHIPLWLPKKLKALRVLKLAKNKVESLTEFAKLRPLANLTQVTANENPVSQLAHYRAFVVFQLRTVENLDGQHVTLHERHNATNRFQQDAVDALEAELQKENQEKEKLKKEKSTDWQELQEKEKRVKVQLEKLKDLQGKIKDMNSELETKNDLLKRKTGELNKACEKHYELEQELAFYKIDHKFDTLGKPKPPTPDSEFSIDEDGLLGESPYIGKGRFKKSEQARLHQVRAEDSLSTGYGSGTSGAVVHASHSEQEAQRAQALEELDQELNRKKKKVPTATLR